MEQFVFLLIIGVIAVIKWLFEKSAELREKNRTAERIDQLERSQPDVPPIPTPRPAIFSMPPDAESAARRLRKALGLPDESDFVYGRAAVERAPMADLEQRTFAPAPVLTNKPLPFRLPAKPSAAAAPSVRSRLDELLKSREGLRSAILAQEILGTPKGLVF